MEFYILKFDQKKKNCHLKNENLLSEESNNKIRIGFESLIDKLEVDKVIPKTLLKNKLFIDRNFWPNLREVS